MRNLTNEEYLLDRSGFRGMYNGASKYFDAVKHPQFDSDKRNTLYQFSILGNKAVL